MVIHMSFSSCNANPVVLDNSHFTFNGVLQVPGTLVSGGETLLYKQGQPLGPVTKKYSIDVAPPHPGVDARDVSVNKYALSGSTANNNLRLHISEIQYSGLYDSQGN
jgi:Large eukaryotic DNA virus major capsid protein/Major capsid protein N-terminus